MLLPFNVNMLFTSLRGDTTQDSQHSTQSRQNVAHRSDTTQTEVDLLHGDTNDVLRVDGLVANRRRHLALVFECTHAQF